MSSSVEFSLPTFDFDFINKPVFVEAKHHYGKKLGEGVLKRIREQHKAGTGVELTPNRAEWLAFKQKNGYYPFPLMQTGQLTDPKNWETKTDEEGGRYEANASEWNKWYDLQKYRDEQRADANWDEAFLVNEGDTQEADKSLSEMMDQIADSVIKGASR